MEVSFTSKCGRFVNDLDMTEAKLLIKKVVVDEALKLGDRKKWEIFAKINQRLCFLHHRVK